MNRAYAFSAMLRSERRHHVFMRLPGMVLFVAVMVILYGMGPTRRFETGEEVVYEQQHTLESDLATRAQHRIAFRRVNRRRNRERTFSIRTRRDLYRSRVPAEIITTVRNEHASIDAFVSHVHIVRAALLDYGKRTASQLVSEF